MTDAYWLDDLDAAWDALVLGTPDSDSLDVDSRQTLGRLHRLQAAADAPLAGRGRAWSPPKRARRRFHLSAPRFSAIHAYGLIAILMLASMAGAYSTTRHDNDVFGGATPPLPAAGGPPLYRVDGSNGTWQRIDPTTLSAIGKPAQVYPAYPQIAGERHWLGFISADASTLVEQVVTVPTAQSSRYVYRIYDAASQSERSEIEPGKGLTPGALSADGKLLFFFQTTASGLEEPMNDPVSRIVVYETATGRMINSLNLVTDASDVLGYPIFDSSGTHAFVLNLNYARTDWQSGTVELTTYDLASGAEIAKVAITGATALQNIKPGPTIKPQYVMAFRPAMTISSDGHTLAVIAWNGHSVSLVDTRNNRVTTNTMLQADGNPCFTLNAGFFIEGSVHLTATTLVTSVMASDSESGVRLLGICSTDIVSGLSVFASYSDVLPAGWTFVTSFLASDAKTFYVTGYRNPGAAIKVDGTIQEFTYGIYALDAKTLAGRNHLTLVAQSADGFPEGLLLTELSPP